MADHYLILKKNLMWILWKYQIRYAPQWNTGHLELPIELAQDYR